MPESLLPKIAVENGLAIAFALFVMFVFWYIFKWLLRHIEQILVNEKENRVQVFAVIDKYLLLIDVLTKKIEQMSSDNQTAHSFQKREHEDIYKKLGGQ